MAHEFKVGDVVRLKSGGPNMTVVAAPDPQSESGQIRCTWMDGDGGPYFANFASACLVPVVPPPLPKGLPVPAPKLKSPGGQLGVHYTPCSRPRLIRQAANGVATEYMTVSSMGHAEREHRIAAYATLAWNELPKAVRLIRLFQANPAFRADKSLLADSVRQDAKGFLARIDDAPVEI